MRIVPQPHDPPFIDLVPGGIGIKLTPRHYAYLKISEGCNHRCTFCIIPSMRGDLVSRPVGAVLGDLAEPGQFRGEGTPRHQPGHQRLRRRRQVPHRLLGRAPGAHPHDRAVRAPRGAGRAHGAWVRLHYVYPYPHVDEVVPLMAEAGSCRTSTCRSSIRIHDILKLMKRPAAAETTLERLQAWRKICPT